MIRRKATNSPLKKPVFCSDRGLSPLRELGDGVFQIGDWEASQEVPELQDRFRGDLGGVEQPGEGSEPPRFATADELPEDQAEVVGGGGE